MSLHDYTEALRLAYDTSFDALIMAAAMRADPKNLGQLQQAFPRQIAEYARRYNARGGRLPEDGPRG